MTTATGGGKGGADAPSRDPIGPMAVRPFGKYFLVRKLAEGGMAEIFLAKQVGVEGFEKNVVIKRMLQHLSSVPDFVSMFLDEARLTARLSHPNIVTISDLGHADGCYYICMEYLAGEDFSTMLRTSARRREYVPLNVSLRVLAEAARGLDFAHSFTDAQGKPLNIVHRDISPSNIFVTYTGTVKVLDFGIAKAESRVTNTTAGVVKGKYMYMAPEQARSGQVDRRADVFSLGVSLYEALTNIRPFARDNDLAILNAVLQVDYTPPRQARPDLPVELEMIVQKALQLDPALRYQSAADLAVELEKFLASTTSASGHSQLSMFMHSFFGPERVASKTRIDSLPDLAGKGWDVPGYVNPSSPKTDPSNTSAGASGPQRFASPDVPTKAIGTSPSVVADRKRQRLGAAAIGALVGVGVLVAGGGVLAALYGLKQQGALPDAGGPEVQLPMVQVDAGVKDEPVDAGALPVPVPAVVDAGAVVVANPPPRCPPNVKPTQMVMRAIKDRYSDITTCFDRYKAELPEDQGKLLVKFRISTAGRISEAQTDMPGTKVSGCVEERIKSIRVPCYTGGDATANLPLQWSVKR
ncbi:MAG: serine/threonine protein kinase [Archangiaceae bacterium]|nr:serine/threonine protein kinase [Archangiaceae bacterium]